MLKSIALLDKVSYQYPNTSEFALKNISWAIQEGEFLGIIGPTGAGKTTLCLALNGIVPQFYGGRFFGHLSIAELDSLSYPVSTLARYVGTVFEDPETQLVTTSVENEIAFALENLCLEREEILARIPRVLEMVRLEGTEKKHPQELSGGQKQRLAIAAALAVQPTLLVLDEPTSQLDPIGSQEVFATVRELNRDLGITVVMVSHAAEEMAEFTDRLVLLSQGETIAIGSPNQIYADIQQLTTNDLRPPQVARTFYDIQQRGVTVPKIPVTLPDGLQKLTDLSQTVTLTPPTLSAQPNHPRKNKFPLISVKNLKHVYADGTEALQNISLEVYEGEYVLIVGQNGAGKSTLVKHFLNLLQPTQGSVKLREQEIKTLSVSDLARSIGYVGQNPDNQIFNTTVEKEVSFALTNLGYPAKLIQERVSKSLAAMNLTDPQSHPLSLPKGDRARIVIAAILAMQPDIIIFDEPTTGQDFQGASSILDVTRQLHQLGKTVIVITHHLYLMPDYAERVIVMGQGTVLLDAPIRQAYHQTELLQSTYLTPPQTVLLAQELSHLQNESYPVLTPQELAHCFS
ncbi:MAG: energy-coupling factor transporter ATPase [Snowella sp.]|nr:energy-coupling factor transporter ATPase [Snowella sp.]